MDRDIRIMSWIVFILVCAMLVVLIVKIAKAQPIPSAPLPESGQMMDYSTGTVYRWQEPRGDLGVWWHLNRGFHRLALTNNNFYAYHDNLGHAVCLAALKAVEEGK